MVMLWSFLALASGLLTVVLLALLFEFTLRRVLPSWSDEAAHLTLTAGFVHLGASFLTALAGGLVAASVAQSAPLVHVLALGIIVLVLAALSALENRGKRARLFLLAQVSLAPLGVLAGGLIRLRMLGVL